MAITSAVMVVEIIEPLHTHYQKPVKSVHYVEEALVNEYQLGRLFKGHDDDVDAGAVELPMDEENEPMAATTRRIPSKVMGQDRSEDGDEWLSAGEAGKLAGKVPSWAYGAASQQRIRSKTVSGRQVFSKKSILKLMEITAQKASEGKAVIDKVEARQAGAMPPTAAPATVTRGTHPALAAVSSILRLERTGELSAHLALDAIAGIASRRS